MSSAGSMEACRLCPRNCGADRAHGKTGFCGMTAEVRIGRAALHMWEEPCISGTGGSGTVFFAGCPLRCVYCQNHDLSEGAAGKPVSISRLAEIYLELQEKGAANINLVTASHYIPQVVESLSCAKRNGLSVPVVFNCGGYEKTEGLKELEGFVDVYLTDFKYMDKEAARRYSQAWDYPERAEEALAEMVRQQPAPVFDENGMMRKGVIVRHLLLPGMVENARRTVRYVYETYGGRVFLSLMNQYTPFARLQGRYPELCRKVTKREYDALTDFALELGVENGYIQEGETAEESFIPSFDGEGIE
jgi:putative pyruvate formate lyase activating enzyme